MENSAQDTNVANNQAELTENSAQESSVTNNLKQLEKKLRKALT